MSIQHKSPFSASLVNCSVTEKAHSYVGKKGEILPSSRRAKKMGTMALLFKLHQEHLAGLQEGVDPGKLRNAAEKIAERTRAKEKGRFWKIRKVFVKIFHFFRYGKAKTTSEWAEYLVKQIPKSKQTKGVLRTFISVLHQGDDGTGLGKKTCALHALKNSLGMLLHSKKENSKEAEKFFTDVDSYRQLFFGMSNGMQSWKDAANVKEDVGIFQLTKIVQGICAKEVISPAGLTKTMQQLEKEQGFPCLSMGHFNVFPGEEAPDALTLQVPLIELQNLADLYQMRKAMKERGSFVHSFVVGRQLVTKRGELTVPTGGIHHWVSCTLKQSGGEREWLCCNSWRNEKEVFDPFLFYAEHCLDDATYLAEEMERGYQLLNQNFLLHQSLLRKNAEDNVYMKERLLEIDAAYAFMKQVEWLKFPVAHKNEIAQLAAVASICGEVLKMEKYQKMARELEALAAR